MYVEVKLKVPTAGDPADVWISCPEVPRPGDSVSVPEMLGWYTVREVNWEPVMFTSEDTSPTKFYKPTVWLEHP